MSLYSDPPPLHSFSEDKPTLLVCWWITTFCTVIIGMRVVGRFIRSETLFAEDKTVALALIPLYMRMACVHFCLIYGTNNAQLAGAGLSDDELRKKSIASGLVLLSRILYAATLWILKITILEFFKRLNVNWERSYEVTLLFIRWTLVATFVAIVISDLAECHPFSRYWQVLPDPGGQCRQGYANLITMAVSNIITDLLLVFFPIPIIIGSTLGVKRKIQLVLLFSLSLGVVGVTLYRVPHIINKHGSQQSRSLYASVELFFATVAANALVLGSFVRDRGTKKIKWKQGSVAAGSMEQSSAPASITRRPTVTRHWGSDVDLVRDTGFGVARELQDKPESPTHARKFMPAAPVASFHDEMSAWQFPTQSPDRTRMSSADRSDESLLRGEQTISSRSNSTTTARRVSFFDVGGLLNEKELSGGSWRTRRDSSMSSNIVDHTTQPSSIPPVAHGLRRGSTAFLQDIGGLLTAPPGRSHSKGGAGLEPFRQQDEKEKPRRESTPVARARPESLAYGASEAILMDSDGLLTKSQ